MIFRDGMRYPVRIHGCKPPNYDFCISQASVATALAVRWGVDKTKSFTSFFVVLHAKNYSTNVSRSYSKNNTGTTVFLRHGEECNCRLHRYS